MGIVMGDGPAFSRWRFLVVGCGSIGRRHVRNLLALGQREVRLVDPDASALEHACAEFGLTGSTQLEDGLVWRPDAVIVANPTAFHIPTALAAARQGCHLFIEKPLGDSLDGADELLRLARERRLVTLVGCNMRFHPGPRLVYETLSGGGLGRVLGARLEVGSYLPSWHPGQDYRGRYSSRRDLGGGVILDAIHELDLACWLFGFPREVIAMVRDGTSLGIETEELAEVLLLHDEPIVSVHLDYVQRWRQRRCEVIGERGSVAWESRRGEVWALFAGAAEPIRLGYDPGYDANEMYLAELRHFLRCLEGAESPCADVEWAARVTRVALAAKESGLTRQPRALAWEPSWSC